MGRDHSLISLAALCLFSLTSRGCFNRYITAFPSPDWRKTPCSRLGKSLSIFNKVVRISKDGRDLSGNGASLKRRWIFESVVAYQSETALIIPLSNKASNRSYFNRVCRTTGSSLCFWNAGCRFSLEVRSRAAARVIWSTKLLIWNRNVLKHIRKEQRRSTCSSLSLIKSIPPSRRRLRVFLRSCFFLSTISSKSQWCLGRLKTKCCSIYADGN